MRASAMSRRSASSFSTFVASPVGLHYSTTSEAGNPGRIDPGSEPFLTASVTGEYTRPEPRARQRDGRSIRLKTPSRGISRTGYSSTGRRRGERAFASMKYSHIWFDLGYTLLYMKREELYASVLSDLGIERSAADIEKAFHLADKRFMRDYPGVLANDLGRNAPWYLGVLNYFLGVKTDLCGLAPRWIRAVESVRPRWHAYGCCHDVLAELKKRGYALGVISNWDSSAKPILAATGLAPYFDSIVISSEVGSEKPSEEIFRIAFDSACCEPTSCLYIGDNYYDDAVGSAKVGMDCVIVNRFGSLGIEELSGVRVIADIGGVLSLL
jgi:putative hydrolase of the HAD superfamily